MPPLPPQPFFRVIHTDTPFHLSHSPDLSRKESPQDRNEKLPMFFLKSRTCYRRQGLRAYTTLYSMRSASRYPLDEVFFHSRATT